MKMSQWKESTTPQENYALPKSAHIPVITSQDFPLANDIQIGGNHYKRLCPEPWDVINAWELGYLDGTALKYISRWRDKGGTDDLRKAIHFLQKLIEVEENYAADSTRTY